MAMPPFGVSMFPDRPALQAKARPTAVDKHGGPEDAWANPGVTLDAYVELVVTTASRADGDQAQPKSERRYRVFTATDSGAAIDDHVEWDDRTLVVLEPSVKQSPLFMFECVDAE